MSDMLEIAKYICLSTTHLSPELANMMESGSDRLTMTIRVFEEGFWVSTYADETRIVGDGSLHDCIAFARKHHCAYILFDRDGPVVEALTKYDW